MLRRAGWILVMGTSVSKRSPRTSRPWSVFRNQLGAGAPPEAFLIGMTRAAGNEWLSMLTSDGIAVYARTAADAWAQMAERLADRDSHTVVSTLLSEARTEALTAGGAGVAVGLAERALARTLLLRLRGNEDTLDSWQQHRGPRSSDLVAGLLGELMRQTAMHFYARDAASQTGSRAIPDIQAFNATARRVGDLAAAAADAGGAALRNQGSDGWSAAVRAAMQSAGGPNPSLGT